MITQTQREEILTLFKEDTSTSLPYCIRVAAPRKGKNLFISCSIHGSEPVGAHFAYTFITAVRNDKLTLNSGSITFLLANYKAFEKNTRYIDADMNRSFHHDLTPKAVWEHRRIAEVREYLAQHSFDLAIDLHSVSVGNTTMIIGNKNVTSLYPLIKDLAVVDTALFFDVRDLPHTLMDEFNSMDVPAIGLECGNHFSDKAITIATKQVYAFLAYLHIMDNPIKDGNHPRRLSVYETVNKIKTGKDFVWLMEDLKTGQFIKKGSIICMDNDNGQQKVDEDCYLMIPSKKPEATDHDAGFLCKKMRLPQTRDTTAKRVTLT